MPDLEALGDAVTGAVLAGAVEPRAGQSASDHTHEANCLNCGTKLAGAYCAVCGQKAHVHRSLRGFFQDMVQGLFNFEGKIWRTLPMLAWRPGELTRRYIAGERARFVSPIALYLFSVFLTFAVLNLTGTLDHNAPSAIDTGIGTAVREQKAGIAKLEKQRAATAAGAAVAALDRKIASEKTGLAQLENVRHGGFTTKAGSNDQTPAWLREVIGKAQKNPELAIYKVQDAASKFSWLLIPLSIPFLWLLFPFSRRYRLYDHTVFVTYSLSFMMMLVIAGGLLVVAGSSGIAGLLFLVPPFHMYRQLKGAYQLGRFGALWRTTALTIFAFVAALLFFILLVALGVLG
ncbi:DUF3667 domain-containing protein [Sphingomonas sp.]|uniref:DUF3667 domain-containing protein n=1 Tax=Sphingomonas sp. TaxID=28214 RepID=UPI00286CABFC|nr:DUF3667 domain-containing protein [Sphingomonas sp.]